MTQIQRLKGSKARFKNQDPKHKSQDDAELTEWDFEFDCMCFYKGKNTC